VVAVDAGTGVYLWKSDFLEAGLLSPTVADLDGNGLPDVVAVSSRGSVFIGRNGKTGIKFERLSYRAEDFSVPAAVIDCDGDGKKEIVLVETRGQTIVLDGSQGTLTKTAAYPRAAIAKMDSSYAATADAYVLSSPAFVAGKGEKRCAMATVLRDPAVVALVRPPAGDPVWARNLSMAVRPDTASGPLYPAPVTADLNRDGHNDLVVALQAGPLLALDGRTGSLIWSYHEPSMWHRVYASPALYDFDKDGTVDAVFGEDAGGVHVVSGRTGASLGSSGPASSPVIGSLMVGDVDGDGKVDIAVQHADGTVRTYRTSSSAPTPASFWPMEGAGPARSGSPGPSGFRTDAKSAELATSTTVLFILLGLNWVLRPRRFSVLTPANAISVHAKPQSCQQDRPGPPAA
jgi:outer membrane protein assembly factor BamB